MTPAAVERALEIRREFDNQQEEAAPLRCRAIERSQIAADLAQRRFLLVDPGNRLVADTLEATLNDALRAVATAREERKRGQLTCPPNRGKLTHAVIAKANSHVRCAEQGCRRDRRRRTLGR